MSCHGGKIIQHLTEPPAGLSTDHLMPLGAGPATGWRVWREAVLRAAGFPADGVLRLAAPTLAATADAYLDGAATEAEAHAAVDAAVAAVSVVLHDLAGEPLFREAVTWQNLNALVALDSVRRGGPNERSRPRRRFREQTIARYWQRYCAKNDTIGFFGPVCWVSLTDRVATSTVVPGPGLTRRRRVSFEWRALAAFGDRLAADPAARLALPAGPHPHLHLLAGQRRVLRPAAPPAELGVAEAAVLERVDGRRPVVEVAAELVAEEAHCPRGLRKAADVYLVLEQLVVRGLAWWGADLPMDATAERRLRAHVEAVGEAAVADFDRLCAARDAVAAAAGDPDRLHGALLDLHVEFAAATGEPAIHRNGETYAGRAVCYEDTERDLDARLGSSMLELVAAPLGVLLQACRWLTVAIADAYAGAFRELYRELVAELGGAEVPFAELWYLAQGPLFGDGERPADAVSAELAARFSRLVDLDDVAPGARELRLTSAELAARAPSVFPADAPGWSSGRIHSPDLQFCTGSGGIDAPDTLAVLGELHAAWATFDSGVFGTNHPDPGRLRDWLAADLGQRVRLLFPPSMPRRTARVGFALHHGDDVLLAFQPAPGATTRTVPVTALRVREVDGELLVDGPGLAPTPLLEVFGELLSMHAADAFKLVSTRAHTPRIVIDRLVVVRETWRTTSADSALATATGNHDRYLAVRRWRRALNLPERVYVKLSTEPKPCYVDLTSPVYASSLCTMVRSAREHGGAPVGITVTEALPGPHQAWVPDADGRRYQSELRLQVVDPVPARTVAVRP